MNLEAFCDNHALVLEDSFKNTGTNCECSNGGSQNSCTDNCQYCNNDHSICYANRNSTFLMVLNSHSSLGVQVLRRFLEVDYTVGPVGVHFKLETDFGGSYSKCKVFLDNQECNSCEKVLYQNGFGTHNVDCRNIQEGLLLNGCSQNSGAGALEILADEEEMKDNYVCDL